MGCHRGLTHFFLDPFGHETLMDTPPGHFGPLIQRDAQDSATLDTPKTPMMQGPPGHPAARRGHCSGPSVGCGLAVKFFEMIPPSVYQITRFCRIPKQPEASALALTAKV
jgi:hypothetical protein